MSLTNIDLPSDAQALRILAYYHANGNGLSHSVTVLTPVKVDGSWVTRKDPLAEFEFEEIKQAIEFDSELSVNVGWSSLFETVGNGKMDVHYHCPRALF